MSAPGAGLEAIVFRKVTRRLIPFMFVLYVMAYLDRVNVGFAALQMNQELGFSNTVFGLGAGIFFFGYVLFEVPSNLILERVGPRVWIARIMISWGLISAGMMFVTSATSFYVLRFLLGVAEAGFFPGMILYLTYWFPAAERARAVARFMTATAIAGVIGGPISAALLGMDGVLGLSGWKWLFLIEGLPSVALGVFVLFYLTDRPEQARWLTDDERQWLSARMRVEHEHKLANHGHTVAAAFSSGKVWLLGILYFLLIAGIYALSIWLPQILQSFSGLSDRLVALLSAVPYMAAAAGMVLIARHSDRTGERRWHVALSGLLGAAGLLLSAYGGSPLLALLGFSLAAVGIWGTLGPFWTLPTSFLGGTAAAAGIALINSIGNLAGFAGPYLIGRVKDVTGSFSAGLVVLAVTLALGAALAVALPMPRTSARRAAVVAD